MLLEISFSLENNEATNKLDLGSKFLFSQSIDKLSTFMVEFCCNE